MLPRLPKPSQIPPAVVMLADVGQPTAAQLAAALGVSVRTVWRWKERDEWPRMALVCLFYASRWGWSAVESDARFQVATHRALADAQARELAALRREVERLARLPIYGSANDARA